MLTFFIKAYCRCVRVRILYIRFFLTIIKLNAIVARGRNMITKTIFFLINYILILFKNLRMLI